MNVAFFNLQKNMKNFLSLKLLLCTALLALNLQSCGSLNNSNERETGRQQNQNNIERKSTTQSNNSGRETRSSDSRNTTNRTSTTQDETPTTEKRTEGRR
mgnify:FL=1